MSTPQLSVRINPRLNEQLNAYINRTGISKTDVVANALAHYLGCVEDVSLTQRMAHLEARMVALEAEVRGN
ncbi:MAG: DNA-binding domain-containing protein [Symploca sp. SIO2E6]|nr:DNA-binding domain-containing protein [Symploca sp. SIO2E6]